MEKTIIEATFEKNKVADLILKGGIGTIVFGFIFSIYVYLTGEGYKSFGFGYGGTYPYTIVYDSIFEFFFEEFFDEIYGIVILLGILLILVAVFLSFEMNRCALTITNKRVVGKASFGKRVDLPLKQISSIGLGIFKRISVASSSGRIHFWLLKNREEVYKELSSLLGELQGNEETSKTTPTSNADELKKYKELLDMGIITQEEFDAKKKELLGL